MDEVNPYRYRGYRYDNETNLYYLNSRYYNPEMGRFINADGIVGFVGVELSHNIYTYTGNNPVMNVDSSGYACELASPDSYGFAGGPCGGGLGLGFYTQSGVPAPGMSKPAAQQMKSQAIDEMKYITNSLEKVATNTYDKVENWVVRAVEDAGNWSKQAGIDTWDWLNGPNWYQTLVRDAIVGIIVLVISAIFVPVTFTGVIITGVGIGVAFVFDYFIWE